MPETEAARASKTDTAAAELVLGPVLSPKSQKGWMLMNHPYSGKPQPYDLLLHKPGIIPAPCDNLPPYVLASRNENIPSRKSASASAAAGTSGSNAEPTLLRPPASKFQWSIP